MFETADGEEALRQLEREPAPQLVLCDVVLPGLSARDVAEAVRARLPRTRVVFMSGHPESQLAQRGLLAPGDLLLSKNFGPEEIARRLREVLDEGVLISTEQATSVAEGGDHGQEDPDRR